MRLAVACLLASTLLPSVSQAQAPVFAISPAPDSAVTFYVKASVELKGTFDKWDATATFTSGISARQFWTSRFRRTA